ncbi:hypothetical protein [Actinoplanes sp. N902-109]|uniref:hypothetical protein n=1 Tax=Actinoplanes sp. (strain N902-109) TaxID=649831 RepID=UPI001E2AAED2|nr:hypothetical protein [Actinoplanes sp. N902-109]
MATLLRVRLGTASPSAPTRSAEGTGSTVTAANLATVNNWIRSKAHASVYGVIEMADLLMTARDSNVRKAPGYTSDGVHPTAMVHQTVMAPALVSYLNTYKASVDW